MSHEEALEKSVAKLMYGFGDVKQPLPESVSTMSDLVQDFVSELVRRSLRIAQTRMDDTITVSDIMTAVCKNPRMVARIEELIRFEKETRQSRRAAVSETALSTAAISVEEGRELARQLKQDGILDVEAEVE
jgi:transcription initiation factor TFIID subunit 13